MLKPQAAFKKLQFKKAIENKIMNDSIHSMKIINLNIQKMID